MKLKYLCIFSALLTLGFTYSTYAQDIRVGLEKNYKNIASVTINNDDLNIVTEDSSYDIGGSFTISPINGVYYYTDKYYDTYKDAVAEATAQSIPAFTDNGWCLYYYENTDNSNSIETSGNAAVFKSMGESRFIANTSEPIAISSDSGIVNLGEYSYRDNIEINIDNGLITLINIIDIEKYLYGVINSEMPASWDLEAQKAQAVAARTYVVATGNKHILYDLCDNTNCQEYSGVNNETEAGRQAVDETKGLEIYYNDEPITAVYFSSDGGATQNSEDVWLSEVHYLRGKLDEYEKECKIWERSYSYSQLTDICNSNGFNIGSITDVSGEFTDTGLCLELTFKGTKGSKTVTKEEIRTMFSVTDEGSLPSRNFTINGSNNTTTDSSVYVIDNSSSQSNSLSSVVVLDKDGNKVNVENAAIISKDGTSTLNNENTTSSSNGFNISGKGYGHGVGMSQYGAKAMAEEGFDFEEILKYYYTDIEID